MKISKIEIGLGALVAVLWLWAAFWVYGTDNVRGPMAPTALSEHGDFIESLPPLPESATE